MTTTTVGDVAVGPRASAWDQSLAARLAAGDERALGEAFAQYGGFVHGLALKVTRDRAAADEVTQVVFVALWERPDRYDPERGPLRPYLGVLAHRRAVDWLRREAASRRQAEQSAAARDRFVPDVAEAATTVLVAQRVREAVAMLPSDQREALELAYFGGLTYRQVAVRLGIPEGTAKSRLRLGLARLATALGPEELAAWT